jgi:hypothetical protein
MVLSYVAAAIALVLAFNLLIVLLMARLNSRREKETGRTGSAHLAGPRHRS